MHLLYYSVVEIFPALKKLGNAAHILYIMNSEHMFSEVLYKNLKWINKCNGYF